MDDLINKLSKLDNCDKYRYAAGVCFAFVSLYYGLHILKSISSWGNWLMFFGYGLIAIGIIKSKYNWISIGAITPMLVFGYNTCYVLSWFSRKGNMIKYIIANPEMIIPYVLIVIACVLLRIAGRNNKKRKIFGLIAGTAWLIAIFIDLTIVKAPVKTIFAWTFFPALGSLLFGMSADNAPINISDVIKERNYSSNKSSNTTDDRIEKLKRLAELRSSGIISQEEFDAMKKQILK